LLLSHEPSIISGGDFWTSSTISHLDPQKNVGALYPLMTVK
jgi:hypothetical protein